MPISGQSTENETKNIYATPSSKGSGITAEEGTERVLKSQVVDNYEERTASGHSWAAVHDLTPVVSVS